MNSKPSILILTDWYYPAYKAGGPITSLFNLCAFLKDDFNFYVLTSNKDLDGSILSGIEEDKWIKGKYDENIIYSSKGLNKSIYKLAIEFSNARIIYLNSLFSSNYTIKPLLWSSKQEQIFLSPRGMLHQQAFSQKRIKKSLFLKMIKSFSSFRRTILVASNEEELREIAKHQLKNETIILPNIPKTQLLQGQRNMVPKPSVCIVSRIAPEKNSLFALNVLKNITSDITVTWIGDSINEPYKKAFLELSNTLPSNIQFMFHGAQNAEFIKDTLINSKVFFLPTLGENFGHAIYEALALGTPAVIGTKTPFFNLEKHKAGFAIDPKSIENNTEALNTILNANNQEWNEFSKKAKDFCSMVFLSDETKNRYAKAWG